MLKARVFISCGQSTPEEKKTGKDLVSYFEKNGFEPYFAEEVHSPLGLTQNIYDNLRKSEYFVCINFKRSNSNFGSLFVQQELAIASYNNTPMIAFHQPSIKLKGVSKYLHVNSIEFNNFKDIIINLDKIIKTWNPKSKNQFRLSLGNEHLGVSIQNQNNAASNWYHVVVENLSSAFTATNCYAFAGSIYDVKNKKNLFSQSEYKNELIWSGTGRIIVNIPYSSKRDIDAICTIQGSRIWIFQETNTSTLYRYPQLSDGHYKIVYIVHSDNLPEAKIELEVKLLNDTAELIKELQIA